MKKLLIIGKRGFIGKYLYKYLKKFYNVKQISFQNLKKIKNKLNNFSFIINTSIQKKYIYKKYNEKFDNDFEISKYLNDGKSIYCFISTRKVYPTRGNLKENSKLAPSSNYSKNKLITEKKLYKKLGNNLLILRVSNIIGDKRSVKKIHKTFIDIFEQNIKKGIIFNNSKIFKDFLSIDKFCQIIRGIIQKNLTGTYNVSIGQKVYLNDLISWLNKFNKEKTIQQKNPSKNQSFFLNNKKLMSKINVKNSLEELKKYCYKYSKKRFS